MEKQYGRLTAILFLAIGLVSCSNEESKTKNGIASRPSLPINAPESIRIGTQVWTAKNLNVDHYRNGDPIPEETDEYNWRHLTTGAWCYYNNDSSKGSVYGKLYNWYAVNDPRGLAPVGWHVPSDNEWTTLDSFLGETFSVGSKMKEVGNSHWLLYNTDATNSSRFTGRPGGYRNRGGGNFGSIGSDGYFWSSTASNTNEAFIRILSSNSGYMGYGGSTKVSGYSVRCVKD